MGGGGNLLGLSAAPAAELAKTNSDTAKAGVVVSGCSSSQQPQLTVQPPAQPTPSHSYGGQAQSRVSREAMAM